MVEALLQDWRKNLIINTAFLMCCFRRTPPSSTGSWTRGQIIERRIHRISSFRPLFGSCDVCKKRFGLISHDGLCCVGE